MEEEEEEEERFFLSFFFSTSTSFLTFLRNRKTKNKKSHVCLLLPLHALRLGDPAAELHSPGMPREQRVRAAQPDAAMVECERWRSLVVGGSRCSRSSRRPRSFGVGSESRWSEREGAEGG